MIAGLFQKMANIIREELEGFLDASEAGDSSKGKVLELTDDVRHRLGILIAERHEFKTYLDKTDVEVAELTRKMEIAVDAGRDDLARMAINERNLLLDDWQAVESDIVEIDAEIAQLETLIAEIEAHTDHLINPQESNLVLESKLAELDALARKADAKTKS